MLADGKEREIQHMAATTFCSPEASQCRPRSSSSGSMANCRTSFSDEDQLRDQWSKPDTRNALLESLAERGFGEEQLREIGRMINAEKSDVYDVLAYIAYAAAPVTREKRVATGGHRAIAPYDEKLRAFLDFVLVQYFEEGVGEPDDEKLPDLLKLKYHSLDDAASQLGGVGCIRDAFIGFQAGLHRPG